MLAVQIARSAEAGGRLETVLEDVALDPRTGHAVGARVLDRELVSLMNERQAFVAGVIERHPEAAKAGERRCRVDGCAGDRSGYGFTTDSQIRVELDTFSWPYHHLTVEDLARGEELWSRTSRLRAPEL